MTALSLILGQVDLLTTKVLAPLGLASHHVSEVLFFAFLFAAFVATYRYVTSLYLLYIVNELCTTGSLRRFAESVTKRLATDDGTIEFMESDVLDFVHVDLRIAHGVDRIAGLCKLRAYSESTVDLLKDLLIAHMINLGLIEAGPPHSLERAFRIKKKPTYVSWSQHRAFRMGTKTKEPADAS